jgi:hypothetical protein
MSLLLDNYTIEAVWSFFTNQLTFILDRRTRIASGEEMLPHFGIG